MTTKSKDPRREAYLDRLELPADHPARQRKQYSEPCTDDTQCGTKADKGRTEPDGVGTIDLATGEIKDARSTTSGAAKRRQRKVWRMVLDEVTVKQEYRGESYEFTLRTLIVAIPLFLKNDRVESPQHEAAVAWALYFADEPGLFELKAKIEAKRGDFVLRIREEELPEQMKSLSDSDLREKLTKLEHEMALKRIPPQVSQGPAPRTDPHGVVANRETTPTAEPIEGRQPVVSTDDGHYGKQK